MKNLMSLFSLVLISGCFLEQKPVSVALQQESGKDNQVRADSWDEEVLQLFEHYCLRGTPIARDDVDLLKLTPLPKGDAQTLHWGVVPFEYDAWTLDRLPDVAMAVSRGLGGHWSQEDLSRFQNGEVTIGPPPGQGALDLNFGSKSDTHTCAIHLNLPSRYSSKQLVSAFERKYSGAIDESKSFSNLNKGQSLQVGKQWRLHRWELKTKPGLINLEFAEAQSPSNMFPNVKISFLSRVDSDPQKDLK